MDRSLSRLRSEGGMAVPAVIVLIAIGLAMATAAATASISALRGSVRDQDTKQALAAADAGAQLAMWRQNQVVTTESLSCVVESLSSSLVAASPLADGWCATQEGTVNGAQYSYRVKTEPAVTLPNGVAFQRRISIVSTGTADGVSRRVKVSAVAPTGQAVFGDSGAIGVDWVTIGGSTDVTLAPGATLGGAGSNGDVTLEDSGLLCGDAQYGPGHGLVVTGSASQCSGYSANESQLNLGRPVVPDTDDNARITNANTLGNDTVSPPSRALNCSNAYCWDPTAKTLTIASNTTLTLGGDTYRFCKLDMQGNSTIVVAAQATTRIYILDPASCPGVSQPQFSMTGNSSLVSTGNDPNAAAVLMAGSESQATTANLSGNAKQNEFLLYAPLTDVTVTGNSTYVGAIAGKTLHMNGSGSLEIPETLTNFGAAVIVRYVRERYVECSVTGGSAPDSNC